jgi:hypothetical protein
MRSTTPFSKPTLKRKPDQEVASPVSETQSDTFTDAQLEALLTQPIAFNRIYAEIAESAGGGVFLSQLKYWSGKCNEDGENPDRWIYKTADEWNDETMLSRRELDSVRKVLREKGVIEEKLAGIPAKLHYRIDQTGFFRWVRIASKTYWEKIEERRANKFGGKRQTGELAAPNRQTEHTDQPNLFGGKRQTTNSAETSSEITSENTKTKTRAREERLPAKRHVRHGTPREESSSLFSCLDEEGKGEEPQTVIVPQVTSDPNEHDSPKDVADKLTETYELNDSQGAQIEGYIAAKGLGYVLEKVELTDMEPRENVGRYLMAALRGDWKPPKTTTKAKPAQRQEPPETVDDNELRLPAAEWDRIDREIAAYLNDFLTPAELEKISESIGAFGPDREELLKDYAARHLRLGKYSEALSDSTLKTGFANAKAAVAGSKKRELLSGL